MSTGGAHRRFGVGTLCLALTAMAARKLRLPTARRHPPAVNEVRTLDELDEHVDALGRISRKRR